MTANELIDLCSPRSFLDRPRLVSLYDRAVEASKLPGCFVECGIGGGGSSALLAGVIEATGCRKHLVVCDTFEGLPRPDLRVDRANGWDDETILGAEGSACPSMPEVRKLWAKVAPSVRIVEVKGLYADTLPYCSDLSIALLHADADWYFSTWQILVDLWPCVMTGGVLVVDDYHFWSGCRKAVDEFFAEHPPAPQWHGVSTSVWGHKPGKSHIIDIVERK
jgi:hypothetical protein